jgi:hypothetical protein
MECKQLILVVGCVAVVLLVFYLSSDSKTNRLCVQEYALCTSAQCIPDPNDHTKAICFCDVERGGPSMATLPCDQLRPSTDQNGIKTVYSTFSLKQARQGKQPMNCPSNTPWTWCLNKKCTVNPFDPSKAVCSCDIKRDEGEWTTFGGAQDTSTCSTGFWSGALLADVENGARFLSKMHTIHL